MADQYIAIDFETTGLDAKSCEVVEIGAVRFRDNGEILETFQSLAKPSKGIPKDAEKIHGITDLMVKDMDTPRAVWDKFLQWAGPFTSLVAHNAEFESLFIQEMYGHGEALPEIKIIDTLRLSKNRLRGLESYKLTDLVGSLRENGHRALPDAHACIQVFMRSAETYKSRKVPPGSYMVSVGSFKYVNPYAPTARQLSYIESLGGDPNNVATKAKASEYIDRLKAGGDSVDNAPTNQRPFFETATGQIIKVMLILAAIVVGWIVILS